MTVDGCSGPPSTQGQLTPAPGSGLPSTQGSANLHLHQCRGYHQLKANSHLHQARGYHQLKANLHLHQCRSYHQLKANLHLHQARGYYQLKANLHLHQARGYHQLKANLHLHQARGYHQLKANSHLHQARGNHQLKANSHLHQCRSYHQLKANLHLHQCRGYHQLKANLHLHQARGYHQLKANLHLHQCRGYHQLKANSTPAPVSGLPSTQGQLTPAPVSGLPSTQGQLTPAPVSGLPSTLGQLIPAPGSGLPSTQGKLTPAPGSGLPSTQSQLTPAPGSGLPSTQGQLTPAQVSELPSTQGQLTPAPGSGLPSTQGQLTPAQVSELPSTQGQLTPAPVSGLPSTQGQLTPAPVSGLPSTQGQLTPAPGSGLVTAKANQPRPAVQYNFIKVEQQVTVPKAGNLNIGGTQNIGKAAPVKEDEEPHLTTIQKLRQRTETRIQTWTEDMVKTEALKKVTDKLDKGASWITIKGSPGEGKSTMAYMALKDQYIKGRQVYQVESPTEFAEVTMTCSSPLVMLDDILGDLEFSVVEWSRWRPVLRPILDPVEHYKEHKDEEQSRKLTIILVGRDYVLQSSVPDLGRLATFITSSSYVIEVSLERKVEEKKQIWNALAQGLHFDKETVEQCCYIDCPHGFPHVCRMFLRAYSNDSQISMKEFFSKPLDFLNQTMNKLINDSIKRKVFMMMIKGDGKVSENELDADEDLGYECLTTANDLLGSYLKREEDTYTFDHPSVYDSVAFILSRKHTRFVITNCSIAFIHQRLRFETAQTGSTDGETGLVAHIPRLYVSDLAKRFAFEILNRNLVLVLSHRVCGDAEFIQTFMDTLTRDHPISLNDLITYTDQISGDSFLELLPSSKSSNMLRYLMEEGNVALSREQTSELMFGVCKHSAGNVLTYLTEHKAIDINTTYGTVRKTPLMIAAETKDTDFVMQILSYGPDLFTSDRWGKTVLHYLCEYGHTAAAAVVTDGEVDVNVTDTFGESPLYLACRSGKEELITLSCKTRELVCLGMSCAVHVKVEKLSLVQILFEKGASSQHVVSGWRQPFHSACKAGDKETVKFLFQKGANMAMVSSNGDTPFHSAAGGEGLNC
ncbi:uncharacterized protein LOC124267919 [Haliotis rubra]|uniref:uncharacterized protein LOC124267919 n=1 Tax=Haliotis rubra TaxID=36100 RepID=UPI001EE5FC44|nr:uncharacterized protein LOC124267919 [Haliotis rubra]